jgi:hypothetical protein
VNILVSHVCWKVDLRLTFDIMGILPAILVSLLCEIERATYRSRQEKPQVTAIPMNPKSELGSHSKLSIDP